MTTNIRASFLLTATWEAEEQNKMGRIRKRKIKRKARGTQGRTMLEICWLCDSESLFQWTTVNGNPVLRPE